MKSIKNNIKNEIIINKSRFITCIYKVNSINEIDEYLNKIKLDYKDATHCCYAYIIDGINKCSDDNEPSGTAGLPILNVLKNYDLNYVLCIVIRYFGGIKLGAGGLVRAYSNSVSKALENEQLYNLVQGKIIKVSFKYDNIKQIDYILKNTNIINKDYSEDITYTTEITNEEYNQIYDTLNNISNIEIIEEKKLSIP